MDCTPAHAVLLSNYKQAVVSKQVQVGCTHAHTLLPSEGGQSAQQGGTSGFRCPAGAAFNIAFQ